MDITSKPIGEAEQAGEKLSDHDTPLIVQIIDAIFERLWQTRITIDIGKRP